MTLAARRFSRFGWAAVRAAAQVRGGHIPVQGWALGWASVCSTPSVGHGQACELPGAPCLESRLRVSLALSCPSPRTPLGPRTLRGPGAADPGACAFRSTGSIATRSLAHFHVDRPCEEPPPPALHPPHPRRLPHSGLRKGSERVGKGHLSSPQPFPCPASHRTPAPRHTPHHPTPLQHAPHPAPRFTPHHPVPKLPPTATPPRPLHRSHPRAQLRAAQSGPSRLQPAPSTDPLPCSPLLPPSPGPSSSIYKGCGLGSVPPPPFPLLSSLTCTPPHFHFLPASDPDPDP